MVKKFDDLAEKEQKNLISNFAHLIETNLENNFEKHLDSLENIEVFYGLDQNGKVISEKNSNNYVIKL